MTTPLTALISDLHSNMPAVRTAVADALERGVQRFVCLGDVVGYGAEPRETLGFVMELVGAEGPARVPEGLPRAGEALETGVCLRGNHEDGLLVTPEDFNPKARAAIEWTRDELASGPPAERQRFFDYLGELEPERVDGTVQYAHGSPRDPLREYVIPRDSQDPDKLAGIFGPMTRGACFIGHSHVPAVYYEDGRIYLPKVPAGETAVGPFALDARDPDDPADTRSRAIVNVGSVGQPRDGDPRLSYVLFDGDNVTFVRLSYDLDTAAARIRAVEALPEYLAERLARGR